MEAISVSLASSRRYGWAALYVAIIVLVNTLFGMNDTWRLVASAVVGIGFVVRDFAQRDIGDRVLGATVLGIAISFVMSPEGIAAPSAFAFMVSETLDWGIVRRMGARPMWQKVAVSHLFSVPLDSALFLGGIAMSSQLGPIKFGINAPWSWTGFAVMTGLKALAAAFVALRRR
jgi:uncharacterized PurR-regulated membrane protein YhhQ (DUF165 family)